MIELAVAKELHRLSIVTLDEVGQTGNTFIDHMPATPDTVVGIFGTGGLPTTASTALGYDEPTVQCLVRGDRYDPVTPRALAQSIYDTLIGITARTFDSGGTDEVRVIRVLGLQSAPTAIGRDEDERYQFSTNFAVHVRAVTANRS